MWIDGFLIKVLKDSIPSNRFFTKINWVIVLHKKKIWDNFYEIFAS